MKDQPRIPLSSTTRSQRGFRLVCFGGYTAHYRQPPSTGDAFATRVHSSGDIWTHSRSAWAPLLALMKGVGIEGDAPIFSGTRIHNVQLPPPTRHGMHWAMPGCLYFQPLRRRQKRRLRRRRRRHKRRNLRRRRQKQRLRRRRRRRKRRNLRRRRQKRRLRRRRRRHKRRNLRRRRQKQRLRRRRRRHKRRNLRRRRQKRRLRRRRRRHKTLRKPQVFVFTA